MELGCDFFELKTLINPKTKAVIKLPPAARSAFRRQLAALREAELPLDLVLAPSIRELISSQVETAGPLKQCYAKKIRAVICPDGVYPCANLRGDKHWYLGDPRRRRFADIWRENNQREINPRAVCRGYCARRRFNLNLHYLRQATAGGADILNYLAGINGGVNPNDAYFI